MLPSFTYLFPLALCGFTLWAQRWRLNNHSGRPARERFIYGVSLSSAFLIFGALGVSLQPIELLGAGAVALLTASALIAYQLVWFRARLQGSVLTHSRQRWGMYVTTSAIVGLSVLLVSRTPNLPSFAWFVAGTLAAWWIEEVFALAYLVGFERRIGETIVDVTERAA